MTYSASRRGNNDHLLYTLGVETFAWRNFRAFHGFELDTQKYIHAKKSQARDPRKLIHAKKSKFRDPRKLILTKIFKLKSLIYQNYIT